MILPHVYASAEDIVLRYKGRTDVPPLMMIHRPSISATIAGLLKAPRHVDKIQLQGLQIHVPPKDDTQPQQVKQPGKKFDRHPGRRNRIRRRLAGDTTERPVKTCARFSNT